MVRERKDERLWLESGPLYLNISYLVRTPNCSPGEEWLRKGEIKVI